MQHNLVLVDAAQADVFRLLRLGKQLFARSESWVDLAGIPWAGAHVDGHWFGVSGLGEGWLFERDLPPEWAAARDERLAVVRAAAREEQDRQTAAALMGLRLGAQA